VVLFCDEYLMLKEGVGTEKEKKANRFLEIAKKLPFELKMLLVRKVYLKDEVFFLSHQFEAGLSRILPSLI